MFFKIVVFAIMGLSQGGCCLLWGISRRRAGPRPVRPDGQEVHLETSQQMVNRHVPSQRLLFPSKIP